MRGFWGVEDERADAVGDVMVEARLLLLTDLSFRRNLARRFWNLRKFY